PPLAGGSTASVEVVRAGRPSLTASTPSRAMTPARSPPSSDPDRNCAWAYAVGTVVAAVAPSGAMRLKPAPRATVVRIAPARVSVRAEFPSGAPVRGMCVNTTGTFLIRWSDEEAVDLL